MDRIEVDITDEAMADLRALPNQHLQRVALQWMTRLRRSPRLGRRLEWRHGQNLHGCRKLYLDETDTPLELDFVPRRRSEEGARYRIVYRLLPSEDDIEIVQTFAVGPKYGPEGGVYARAAERYRLMLEQAN